MSTFTTQQTGNAGVLSNNPLSPWYDAGAQTALAAIPTIGDTIVVANTHTLTQNVKMTVGLDGITGTIAITVNTGGAYVIAAGVTLTVRGDIYQLKGTTVTVLGILVIDAATGVNYMWTTGVGGAGTCFQIITGTAGAYAIIARGGRGGTAQIMNGDSNTKVSGDIVINYARFTNLGTTTLDALGSYVTLASARINATNTIWVGCGRIQARASIATAFCVWTNTTLINPLSGATDAFNISFPAVNTTGTRSILNFFAYSNHATITPIINVLGGLGFSIENMILYRHVFSANAVGARLSTYNKIFMLMDITPNAGSTFRIEGYTGQNVKNSIFYGRQSNPHHITVGANLTVYADTIVEDNICDGDDFVTASDWGEFVSSGVVTIRRNIVYNQGGNLCTQANVACRQTIYNNTISRAYPMNCGETFGHADQLVSYKNNLMHDMLGNCAGTSPQLNLSRGMWQHGQFVSQNAANLDNNVWWDEAGNSLDPLNLTHPVQGKSYIGKADVFPWWVDLTVYGTAINRGLNDLKADPQFIDKTVTLRKWVGVVLSMNTSAYTFQQLADEIFKVSGFDKNGTAIASTGLTIDSALAYIRNGFKVQNPLLAAAGQDGSTIGALTYEAPAVGPSVGISDCTISINIGISIS